MIGPRPAIGMLAAIALGLLLALRPGAADRASPATEAERAGHAADTARDAIAALDRLAGVVDRAIGDARTGSALVISGSESPGPRLEAAATALETGSGIGAAAVEAVRDLAATLHAASPEAAAPQLVLGPADLLSIASQLRQSAEAAGPFVERRRAAEATLQSMATAIAALSADQPAEAMRAIAAARTTRAVVAAWRGASPELAVWLNTTGEMLAAGQRIADALVADDADAAAAGGEAYRVAADHAAAADRALALSIAEVGSAITATPLRRLATVSQAIGDARAATAMTIQALGG